MPGRYRQFSPEFKDEAVRLVIEASRSIAQVARELGINEGTLGNWVNRYRAEHVDDEPPLDVSERARLRDALGSRHRRCERCGRLELGLSRRAGLELLVGFRGVKRIV